MVKNFFAYVFELVKVVVISLAIIIPIRYYLIQPFYVKGASMEPNFYDKEYLIIDEISYRFHEPARGDIVVFRYPRNPEEFFIKRVIGLPGERIQVKDGFIYIYNQEHQDGAQLAEKYLPADLRTYALNDEITTLNDGEYYVLGDNRNSSKDSRSFGAVDKKFITGKALLRGWPFNRIDVFSAPQYSY
ncbi:MAG: Signal peptidase I [Parcubacteria group bacterium GW2011_GWC2_42_12]|uniref:Signal peptidase I n=1 Tax=Candidatus Falkowbacteria bacterium RIFCSPHIGHO2_02_FULL_42_9 TaxID=1797986 RepID=A0A1F5SA58_9BACT|nr:MAG: Signal peptidase I [Parcubacteria group bacterium GW2011_GWC2_42_12]OGF23529.1 MAG: signal peptidase I [Candidatus Falkowbacteria bacterium RIFCSPHIGHO2_02_FULL_42_9]